jgi:hypothetical protein
MKIKVLILVGILIIAFAAVVIPVSASDPISGTTELHGNVLSYVSISVSTGSIALTLDPQASQPITNSNLGITISANKAATVTVKDNTGRITAEKGKMGNYTSSYDQATQFTTPLLNTTLASPLGLVASSTCVPGGLGGTITPVSVSSPIRDAVSMFTTTGVLSSASCPANQFSQTVAKTDPVLPAGSTYRMDLEFDIAAN